MATTEELMAQYGVAWFGFDEASGNVYDKLSNNYVGTVTGATRVQGWNGEGSAMNFDGNDYITFNDKIIPIGDKTIRLKFKKTDSNTGIQNIFANTNATTEHGITIFINNNILYVQMTKGVSGSPNLLLGYDISNKINKYIDVNFTFDNSTLIGSLYIDDMSTPVVKTKATQIETSQPTRNARVGANFNSTITYFAFCQIDDLQIYSKALTPSDFTQTSIAIKTQDNKNLVLPKRTGRVKEIPSIEEIDLINQGYTWREIDNAVDATGIDLTQPTTEYEKVSKTNTTLGNGKMFTIPVDDFKTIKIEGNY